MTTRNLDITELLKDEDTLNWLLHRIQEKDQRRRYLTALLMQMKEQPWYQETAQWQQFFYDQAFHLLLDGELPRLEKDLKRLVLHLRIASQKAPETAQKSPVRPMDNEWLVKYQHATERVSMEQLIRYYVHELPPGFPKRNIKCPLHKDDSPSFHVYENNNRFVCFGCGESGSPLDFIQKMESLDFREAVEFLQNF